MRTNQERVRIGLAPIYHAAPHDIALRLDVGYGQRLFECWSCALQGAWETTVVDPGARDTLLCPSCHEVVGTVEDGTYDATLGEWRMACVWRKQPWRAQRIPVTGGAAKDFLLAMGWHEEVP